MRRAVRTPARVVRPELVTLDDEAEGESVERSLGVQFGGADIFEPVEAPNYILEALDLCPGPPSLLAGRQFAGKTPMAQALALAVATGLPAWGAMPVRRGRVAHLDYEQGQRLTRERYQRLALAMGLGPADLQGRLEVVCYPRRALDDRGAEATLVGNLAGFDLAIIDSFRAACPKTDENASTARAPLDMLARVSEQTGCAFLVLHHARKATKDEVGGESGSVRGSSALLDAAASVLVMTGLRPGAARVAHTKARSSGVPHKGFTVTIADVEREGAERWGLAVEVVDAAEASAEAAGEHDRRILQIVRTSPGATKRAIRAAASGVRASEVDSAVQRLLAAGTITREAGSRGAFLHFAKGEEQ